MSMIKMNVVEDSPQIKQAHTEERKEAVAMFRGSCTCKFNCKRKAEAAEALAKATNDTK